MRTRAFPDLRLKEKKLILWSTSEPPYGDTTGVAHQRGAFRRVSGPQRQDHSGLQFR
jgi:hypothetical protein